MASSWDVLKCLEIIKSISSFNTESLHPQPFYVLILCWSNRFQFAFSFCESCDRVPCNIYRQIARSSSNRDINQILHNLCTYYFIFLRLPTHSTILSSVSYERENMRKTSSHFKCNFSNNLTKLQMTLSNRIDLLKKKKQNNRASVRYVIDSNGCIFTARIYRWTFRKCFNWWIHYWSPDKLSFTHSRSNKIFKWQIS